MIRIFIVEDDRVLAGEIAKHLEMWGYETVCADSFTDILETFRLVEPHIALMDISLPFYNGYYRCREIRKESSVPIIFLSSSSDNLNIVTAIEMGGDDFVAKPFDMAVLTAKIQAMVRRVYGRNTDSFKAEQGSGGRTADGRILISQDAALNTGEAALSVRGERVELSINEYRILQLLAENRGQAVSRSAIMERLWKTDSYVDDNTLTVNITRLRKKLDSKGLCGIIETKRGEGYVLK